MDAEKVSGLIADKVIKEVRGHMPDDAIRSEFRDTIKYIALGVLNWELEQEAKATPPPPQRKNGNGAASSSEARGKALYSDVDPFPFGKHKNTIMCQMPNHYWDWLSTQAWVEEDWPGVFKYMNGEVAEGMQESSAPEASYTETQEEKDNIPF